MATMIPDIDPGLIENNGEQRFYEKTSSLPTAYSFYYRGEGYQLNFSE